MPRQKRAETIYISEVPRLLAEWDFGKNDGLGFKPDCVASKSDKKVWWRCQKGHSWQSSVGNRSVGKGCPYCAGHLASEDNNLSLSHPELCAEWDYAKNNGEIPGHFLPCSRQKVWWKCQKCGYEWAAMILSRTQSGSGCPHCARQEMKPRKYTIPRKRVVAEESSPTY